MSKRNPMPDLLFDPDVNHAEHLSGGYMTDWVECSCGWRSNSFWDGDDLAHDEWVKHKAGIHVYVLKGEGYGCGCRLECEETFKSMRVRELEEELEELKR